MTEFETEVEFCALRLMARNGEKDTPATRIRYKNIVRQRQGRRIKQSLSPLTDRPFGRLFGR